jgi:hypothetical protein
VKLLDAARLEQELDVHAAEEAHDDQIAPAQLGEGPHRRHRLSHEPGTAHGDDGPIGKAGQGVDERGY